MAKSKMYILVKDSLTPGHVALACAHASLSGYLTFVKAERSAWENQLETRLCLSLGMPTATQAWAEQSFRKVICSVSDEQFEQAKTFGVPGKDYRVMIEHDLCDMEISIVMRPRIQWEPFFKSLKLFQ